MRIKEIRVPQCPDVYHLVKVMDDGTELPTTRFRVRKRIKIGNKWTTNPRTFENLESAEYFARHNNSASKLTHRRDSKFSAVFERFITHKREKERLAEGSLSGYENRAKHFRFFEVMKMEQITSEAVDVWLDLMYSKDYLKLQNKTRINYAHEYDILSGIFTYFKNHESNSFTSPLLDRHRKVACARPKTLQEKEIRFLTPGEEASFLLLLADYQLIQDIALFQLHTGARIGEGAALEFNSIDFTANEVIIRQHLDWERKRGGKTHLIPGTKGGPTRRIPLTNDCREMLLRRKRQASSSIVFESAHGGWLHYRVLQAAYDRRFMKMGIPHRGTHTLRHTFAVRFLDQTKDIHALQRILGHASLEETLRYAKYTNESVKRSFQLFRGGLVDPGNSSHVRPTALT